MQLSDFHYDIPDELIAATPPAVRGTSRLLVLDRQTGIITDRHYPDVVDYLQAGDVLVINDTKVIKARSIAPSSQLLNGIWAAFVIPGGVRR